MNHEGQASGSFYGSSPYMTSYKASHGEGFVQRGNSMFKNVPSFEDMKKNNLSLTREAYDELLKAKPYVPRYHIRKRIGKNDTH